ncbi:hypothetical protein [Staphylococcus succinus]|uniref:hypothetical protein n=1 Tax=Staphylococcus succinus TaxID=61015 RepID=UPI000E699065|nr:hypothetical protein [Staphylococcus succinus]RIN26899.1 hypothetical protein BU067_03945 [Staphylococcus succinus]
MSLIAWLIIICEVSFWMVVLAGLCVRYIFKNEKLGFFVLSLTLLVDLALVIFTSLDLYIGATATTAHALAAVYISISLIFGKDMIRWADNNFKYYIMKKGGKPSPTRYKGIKFAIQDAKTWLKHLLSYSIGTGLLWFIIFLINDPKRTFALHGVIKIWTIVLVIDLIVCITYFIWPEEKSK